MMCHEGSLLPLSVSDWGCRVLRLLLGREDDEHGALF